MLIKQTSKIQFFAFISALFLATAINAAEQASPKAQGQKKQPDRFEAMSQKLQLTEKQKADLKPMMEKLKKTREETLKKLDEQELKELSTILKPEQANQVSRYLKRGQRMGGVKEGMKNGEMGQRKMGGGNNQNVYPKPPAKLPPKQ